jgi:transposase-like protein
MDAPKTLQQAIQYFSDYENCRKFMIAMRWEDGVVRCPYCGSEKVTYLENAKLYRCYGKHTRQKFSLKVGTIFEDSPIGLDKWLPAVWLLVNCKNGISSYELARAIGVTQKTAWFILHRIREAMHTETFIKIGGKGGAPIEMDECFVGGKAKNMHAARRNKLQAGLKGDHKTPVFGMLDRKTRQVRATAIPAVKRDVLLKLILENIERKSTVYTDNAPVYDPLKVRDFVHETVTHIEEYVRGEVHTQGIENFWSLLKRSLNGTYVAVEPYHLDRYVTEQAFRFNNRKNKTDYDRFVQAVSQIQGKRLTYAEVTGKVEETAF